MKGDKPPEILQSTVVVRLSANKIKNKENCKQSHVRLSFIFRDAYMNARAVYTLLGFNLHAPPTAPTWLSQLPS